MGISTAFFWFMWSNVDRVYRKWNCMFLLLDLYSMRLLPYTHLPLILTNPYYT